MHHLHAYHHNTDTARAAVVKRQLLFGEGYHPLRARYVEAQICILKTLSFMFLYIQICKQQSPKKRRFTRHICISLPATTSIVLAHRNRPGTFISLNSNPLLIQGAQSFTLPYTCQRQNNYSAWRRGTQCIQSQFAQNNTLHGDSEERSRPREHKSY